MVQRVDLGQVHRHVDRAGLRLRPGTAGRVGAAQLPDAEIGRGLAGERGLDVGIGRLSCRRASS
jgi:hypothetical protein